MRSKHEQMLQTSVGVWYRPFIVITAIMLVVQVLTPQDVRATPDPGDRREPQPSQTDLVVRNAKDLSRCTKGIQSLVVKTAVTVQDLKIAPNMSSIESCELRGWDVPESILKEISLRMPRLANLEIEKCGIIDGKGLAPLEALKELAILRIEKLAHPEEDYCQALEKLEALEFLHLDGTGLTLSGVQQMGELSVQSLYLLNLSNLAAGDLEKLEVTKFSKRLLDLHFYSLTTMPENLDWLLPLKQRLLSVGITGSGSWSKESLSALAQFSASSWTLSNVTESSGAPVALGSRNKESVNLVVVGDKDMLVSDWQALVRSKALSELWIASCNSLTAFTLTEILEAGTRNSPETIHIKDCPQVSLKGLKELHEEWGKERIVLHD